ncbi:MAG TPA: ACT domain-containing protein [Candidatus Aminicenantes bacterium]|nr:ACT domain-containing protein [Candidatus Aminicenantes bacterium]HRY65876.1 ACT domain-containing protein [Candidatus Aminicenantes bacterium]HRZ72798.1 ACT domain-containing protein [Candidatus Aminicenantes bacterium]
MKRSDVRRYFKNGRAVVAPGTYAIVKSKRALANSFAVIKDDRETTCIIEEAKLGSQKFLGFEGDWRLITFDMVLPLSLVGFLAAVSGALADAGVNIFSLSAYTTDHVFVKDQMLETAIKSLEKLGLAVRRR